MFDATHYIPNIRAQPVSKILCKNRQGVILYFWIFILSCSFVFKDFGIWFLKNRVPKKPVTEREIFRGDLGERAQWPPCCLILGESTFSGFERDPYPPPLNRGPPWLSKWITSEFESQIERKKSGFNVILLPGLINIQWIEMLYYYYIYLIKYKTINIAILSIKKYIKPL